jgi:O-antigen/teichoic acid export membrane protein
MSPDAGSATGVPGEAPVPHAPIAANAVWRLLATIARIGIGFVAVSVYARVLGMSQWGLLALFQAATAPLAIAELGGGTAAVKYVAEAVGRRDPAGAVRVVHTTFLFNLGIGLAGAAAINLLAPWLATSAFAIPAGQQALAMTGFRIASVSWVLGMLTATVVGVLSAHQRYDWVSKLTTASTVCSAGTGASVAFAGGSVAAVVAAQAAVAAATAIVGFSLASRLLPGIRAAPRWDRPSFHRSFTFGSWQAIAMAGGIVAGWSDRYILGALLGPTMVGFYAVALTLEGQLYATFHDLGEVLFPAVSHREGTGDLRDARRLVLLGGWALSSAFGAFAAVLAAVGGDFLCLWISGEAARHSGFALRVLCVGGIIGIAITGPYYYMLGTARTRWAAALALVSGAATAGASLLLVGRYGVTGVAAGVVCGSAVQWLFAVRAWKTAFAEDVRFAEFAVQVFAPPLVSLALLAGVVSLHDAWGHAPSWPRLIVETALALPVIGALQLLAGEALPGGSARRRAVTSSFVPVIASFVARARERAGGPFAP